MELKIKSTFPHLLTPLEFILTMNKIMMLNQILKAAVPKFLH